MRALFIASLLALAACNASSPCADYAKTSCIDAKVKGAGSKLDQLRITITKAIDETKTSPSSPKSFSLPADLAIALPTSVAGQDVSIEIDALSKGVSVSHASWSGTAPAIGKPISVPFELVSATTPDAGSSDGAVLPAVDAGPSVLTAAALSFGPKPANHLSTLPLALTNPTSEIVTIDAQTFAGDPVFGFGAVPSSDTMACERTSSTITVGAQASCNVYVTYAPTALGPSNGTLGLVDDHGATLVVPLSGSGVAPSYANESPQGSTTNFGTVSGASDTSIFAGGNGTACVYHYDGSMWTNVCNGLGGTYVTNINATSKVIWLALSTSSTTSPSIWIGASDGSSWTQDAGLDPPNAGTYINVIESPFPGTFYAGISDGHLLSTPNNNDWNAGTNFGFSIDAIASNGATTLLAGNNDSLIFVANDSSHGNLFQPTELMSSTQITGAWATLNSDFYFTAQGADGFWGVWSLTANATAPTRIYKATLAGSYLNAISGFVRPDGTLDLYAVGSIGGVSGGNNAIAHGHGSASGGFTFVDESCNGEIYNAVWVSPTGGVVAVGAGGAIIHLH